MYYYRKSIITSTISLVLVCLFMANDLSVTSGVGRGVLQYAPTNTLAPELRFKPFSDKHTIAMKNVIAASYVAQELWNIIWNRKEPIRPGEIGRFNQKLAGFSVTMIDEDGSKEFIKDFPLSNSRCKYAVFNFKNSKKEDVRFRVYFVEEPEKLTDEKERLKLAISRPAHWDLLKGPSFRGVWFEKEVSPTPPAGAGELRTPTEIVSPQKSPARKNKEDILGSFKTYEGIVYYPCALNDFAAAISLAKMFPKAKVVLGDGFVDNQSDAVSKMPDRKNIAAVARFLRNEIRKCGYTGDMEVTIKDRIKRILEIRINDTVFEYRVELFEDTELNPGVFYICRPGYEGELLYRNGFWEKMSKKASGNGIVLLRRLGKCWWMMKGFKTFDKIVGKWVAPIFESSEDSFLKVGLSWGGRPENSQFNMVDVYALKDRHVLSHPSAGAGQSGIVQTKAINDINLNPEYMPKIHEKTLLCHIVTDTILPAEQGENLLNLLETSMRGRDFIEKIACLRLDRSRETTPAEFIERILGVMERARSSRPGEFKDYDIEFDVACPSTELAAAVMVHDFGTKVKVRALAFESCKAPVQADGIILALRALRTGDVSKLKEVFRFLGGDMSKLTEDITTIEKFVRQVSFNLPKAEAIDVEGLNKTLTQNIISTAA